MWGIVVQGIKTAIVYLVSVNEDEIYQVQLILYDGALEKRVATVKESCELCAASEVNDTLTNGIKNWPSHLQSQRQLVRLPKVTCRRCVCPGQEYPSGSEVFLGKCLRANHRKLQRKARVSHDSSNQGGLHSPRTQNISVRPDCEAQVQVETAPPSAVAAQAKNQPKVEAAEAASPLNPWAVLTTGWRGVSALVVSPLWGGDSPSHRW